MHPQWRRWSPRLRPRDTGNEDTSIMALTEEQPPEDDPVMRAALFETATPLPDIDTLRPLPPFRRDASGPLVVQFQLNEAGKITVLERVTVTTVTESETTEDDEASEEAEAPQEWTMTLPWTACCAKCDAPGSGLNMRKASPWRLV